MMMMSTFVVSNGTIDVNIRDVILLYPKKESPLLDDDQEKNDDNKENSEGEEKRQKNVKSEEKVP